jgi:NADH:ubiquinone oxidoreductase subunit F (NADH-binding)
MKTALDRRVAGTGNPGDTAALAALAEVLETASFCGLGQSAAWPITSALQHFGAAFATLPLTGEHAS